MPDAEGTSRSEERRAALAAWRQKHEKKLAVAAKVAAAVAVAALAVAVARRASVDEDWEADEPINARTKTPEEEAFEEIVHAAAEHTARIEDVSVQGFAVEAKVRSKRGTWDASFFFDSETGHYHYSCPYPDANAPIFLGDTIQELYKEAVGIG
ncbi:hypothetical protein ACH4NI_35105 [Streptomyces olivaceus]|uniref:hypothetical protein n=1 Tax=Streptomyces olivaceus TaxID=47716 RepID=UPI00379FBBEC